jgi:hypothetical protein
VAVDPIAIGQSPFLLREALLGFLVAALLWARTALTGRSRAVATAALLAAATLPPQLYVLLFAFLLGADALALGARSPRARWNLAVWAGIGLLVATSLLLWARRNERVTGQLSFTASSNAVPARELWLTSECSNNWLSGDLATGFQYLAFAEERRLVDEVGLAAAKTELYRRTWVNWRDHPLRSLGRLLRINLWYWLEVPGAVRLAASDRLRWTRCALLPFHSFFALAPALLYPVPRYLGPAYPALDLLAVLGLAASWARRAT